MGAYFQDMPGEGAAYSRAFPLLGSSYRPFHLENTIQEEPRSFPVFVDGAMIRILGVADSG